VEKTAEPPTPFARLNAALDALPRTHFEHHGRERPAFLSCGIAGFYLALGVTLTLGPLAGRDPVALAAAAAACALSFFASALGRKLVTGRERLVLLEHTWLALAAAAAVLWAMRAPVRAHLNAVAAGLAFFLALGRCGCLLVGCCHGRPASVGLRYPDACARNGFPAHLVGVRLFSVQALEALGLVSIGFATTAALLLGPPGAALAAFLIAYAILRFGLEGLRGDRRPEVGGLSQARWMATFQLGAGLLLASGRPLATVVADPRTAVVGAALGSLLLARGLRHLLRRDLASAGHVRELRALVRELAARDPGAAASPPSGRTSAGVVAAVSPALGEDEIPARLCVSLSQDVGRRDLQALCRLGGRAFPALDLESPHLGERILFFTASLPDEKAAPGMDSLGEHLYGRILQTTPPAAGNPQTAPPSRRRYFGTDRNATWGGSTGGWTLGP
jgi:hypothetical protein